MAFKRFEYTPACTHEDCEATALYKLAAEWSDGRFRELKTYGFACELHLDTLLEQARAKRARLVCSEGESVHSVGVYSLDAGSDASRLEHAE